MWQGERPPRITSRIVASVVGLVLALGFWASASEVEEVTRGQGRVIPSSRTQVIQSTDAGVIQEILVRLGQRVSRDDILIRLDNTPTASRAGEIEAQSRALQTQIARLEAEGAPDGAPFICPDRIIAAAPEVCESEFGLFKARRLSQGNRLEVLQQRVNQRQREMAEIKVNIARYRDGLKLAQRELDIIAPMAKRNLSPQTELLRTQRQVVELTGQLAGATEAVGRLESALDEARLQVAEQNLQFQREAIGELTTRRAELSVLLETMRGAADRVRRTDIRSPVDGIVNALPLTTLGAFVNAGDRVVEVVPVEDKLLVEARIRPADIAFISPGQKALVKITAYDFSQFGGLNGIVEQLAVDSLFDPNQKEAFFTVIIRTTEAHLSRGSDVLPIIPGMVCDVEIITGKKSIASYLLKPINKARHEALRER